MALIQRVKAAPPSLELCSKWNSWEQEINEQWSATSSKQFTSSVRSGPRPVHLKCCQTNTHRKPAVIPPPATSPVSIFRKLDRQGTTSRRLREGHNNQGAGQIATVAASSSHRGRGELVSSSGRYHNSDNRYRLDSRQLNLQLEPGRLTKPIQRDSYSEIPEQLG